MERQIIEFVKNNPILYERKYKSNSKFREEKMEKWVELSGILRKDLAFVKQKWKNLRDTYRKQLIRKPKGSGDEEEFAESSNWKFFEDFSFLKEQYINQKSEPVYEESDYDSLPFDTDDSHLEEPEETEVDMEVENFDLNEYLKRFDAKTAANATGDKPNETAASVQMSAEAAHQAKRKKFDKDAIITEACQEMSSLLHNAKQHFMPPSPNQVFFNSIALQVEQANLSPMDLMRLHQRVLELVTQEIVYYQERSYIVQ